MGTAETAASISEASSKLQPAYLNMTLSILKLFSVLYLNINPCKYVTLNYYVILTSFYVAHYGKHSERPNTLQTLHYYVIKLKNT